MSRKETDGSNSYKWSKKINEIKSVDTAVSNKSVYKKSLSSIDKDGKIRKFILDSYLFGYSAKLIVKKIKLQFNKDVSLKTVYNVKYNHLKRAKVNKKTKEQKSEKVGVFKGKVMHEVKHYDKNWWTDRLYWSRPDSSFI